jgi:hypothetical protein
MKKGKRPAHQNVFAFKHNKNSKLTRKIAEEPVDVLCVRCIAKLVWRKKFRKYKQRTVPGRCNVCQQKEIIKAYRTICDKCANEKEICAKCTKYPICSDPEEMQRIEKKAQEATNEHELSGDSSGEEEKTEENKKE